MITGIFNSNLKAEATPMPIAYYNVLDKMNSDADRDILMDLTGNGYDLKLENFSFTDESGYKRYEPVDFNDLFPSDLSILFPDNYVRNEVISSNGFNINLGDKGPVRLHSKYMPNGTFKIKFKISGVDDLVSMYKDDSFSPDVRLYAWGYDGVAHSYKNTLIIVSDGEYEWSTTFDDEYNMFTIGVATENPIDTTYPEKKFPSNIVISQSVDNCLVFDGVDDIAYSIKTIPAFNDDNYTFIFDVDVLSNDSSWRGIFYKAPIYLYKKSSDWLFYNLNSATPYYIPYEHQLIAITNNKAYSDKGQVFVNTVETTGNSIASGLLIGRSANTIFCNFKFRSMAVFDGINLDYKMIKRVYNMMIDNKFI